jgi:hypothetical protein
VKANTITDVRHFAQDARDLRNSGCTFVHDIEEPAVRDELKRLMKRRVAPREGSEGAAPQARLNRP